jgi:hypothetical protein
MMETVFAVVLIPAEKLFGLNDVESWRNLNSMYLSLVFLWK